MYRIFIFSYFFNFYFNIVILRFFRKITTSAGIFSAFFHLEKSVKCRWVFENF